MSLLIGFLTFLLVVTCLLLILLVLVQLPKKEAGAGLAFGAGTVDTLIGAGSGNALTKMTKYIAGIFLGLSVLLAVLNSQRHQSASRTLQQELARKSSLGIAPALPPNNANAITPAASNRTTAPAAAKATVSNAAAPSGTVLPLENVTPNSIPIPPNNSGAAQPQTTPAAPAKSSAPAAKPANNTPAQQPKK